MKWFSRKQKIKPTICDNKRYNMHIELLKKQEYLLDCTKRLIVKNGVVDLYPEGADKEAAKCAVSSAQSSFLAAIAGYDLLRIDLLEYIKGHNEFVTTAAWPTDYKTSHELIEYAYAQFFQTI